jgi:hypothetical protein
MDNKILMYKICLIISDFELLIAANAPQAAAVRVLLDFIFA